MKHTKCMALGTLLLLLASGATAQSLGDAARAARKNKVAASPNTRHFDNDNLPTNDVLSIVGPTPAATTGAANSAQETKAAAVVDAASVAAEHKKTADEWKSKLDKQQDKIDSLSHELDLQQREYRLRAAAFYGDAGTRLRDAAQFDRDDVQYKSDVDQKQKAIEAARQELSDMREQARKAGMVEKDKDSASDNNK